MQKWVSSFVGILFILLVTSLPLLPSSGRDPARSACDNPPLVTLTIHSQFPDNGVPFTVDPPDDNGIDSGSTPMNLTYPYGTEVTVTVPDTFNGQPFSYWNGISGNAPSGSLTVTEDETVTATYVPPPACPGDDPYEPDYCGETPLSVGETQSRIHCDEDWATFVAQAGATYVLETSNLTGGADTVLDLYDQDSSTPIASDDNGGGGLASRITWTCDRSGLYCLDITESQDIYASGMGYDLTVRCSDACPSCPVALERPAWTFPPGGISSYVIFFTHAGCPWNASSDVPWITLTSPANGTGSGVVSFDVAANPGPASREGHITINATPFTIFQSGTMLPGCPERVGIYPGGSLQHALVQDGATAYAAVGSAIVVLDVTSPVDPQPITAVPLDAVHPWGLTVSFPIRAMKLDDPYLYVLASAFSSSYLKIIDVSNPYAPLVLGSWTTPTMSTALAVNGSTVALGGPDDLVHILDVSNPSLPAVLGTIPLPANDLAFLDHYLYDLNDEGLYIYDVASPLSPAFVGCVATGYDKAMTFNNRFAYLIHNHGMGIYDFGDPENPVFLGSYTKGAANFTAAAVRGATLYLATTYYGLITVDVSDPVNPIEMGILGGNPTYAYDVALSRDGSHALLSARTGGLGSVDVTDPSHPVADGGYFPLVAAGSMALSGNLLYVTAYFRGGVDVISLADPSHPVKVGQLRGLNDPSFMVIEGTYAYVTTSDGLAVLDLSNPLAPVQVGSLPTASARGRIVVRGNRLYGTTDNWLLFIVDISQPSSPTLIGSYDPGLSSWQVYAYDHYLYLTSGIDKIVSILDIADPDVPVEVNRMEGVYFDDMDFAYPYAYVTGDFFFGVRVWEISDPVHPVTVGAYDDFPYDFSTTLSDRLGLVAGWISLSVLDLSDPHNPYAISTSNVSLGSFILSSLSFGRYVLLNKTDYFWSFSNGIVAYDLLGCITCTDDLGDVTFNGQITAYDAAIVLQSVVGLRTLGVEGFCRADVDRSQTVTSLDASYILQCTVGLCGALPSDFSNSCSRHGQCP